MYTNRQNTNQQSPVRHSARLKKVSGGKKTNERGCEAKALECQSFKRAADIFPPRRQRPRYVT